MWETARRRPEVRRLMATTGLLSVVVAAGCGGGSPASPEGSPADVATAARINLHQSDFPAGWQSRPDPVTSAANTQAERAVYACLGTSTPESHATANANSPAFVTTAQQASSNVKLTRTPAQSQADYTTMAGPAAGDCTRKVLLNTLPGALPFGSTVASSTESDVSTAASPGDQVAAFLVTVDLDVRGGQTRVYAQFTTILHGRAVAAVQTIGLGEPFPSPLQQTIVSNVESRANSAPA